MTVTDTLAELAALGTEQNRTIYRRHGVRGPLFGVSYANLGTLTKRLKGDQALAEALWASGNHDARVLATMTADARQTTLDLVERWVADLDNHTLTDALVDLIGRAGLAQPLMERWIDSDEEWRGRLGWHLLGRLAMKDAALPDTFFLPYLVVVEQAIHGRPNRVREAMNNALIAIGVRNDALERPALAVAARIGPVAVDHGETNCRTPDAADYIARTRQRQHARRTASARR